MVGLSGSGKSTIAKLIQGLYPPDEGMVKVGGHNICELDLEYLRRSIGVVLQDNHLFSGTVFENVAAGALLPDKEAMTQIMQTHISQLRPRANTLPRLLEARQRLILGAPPQHERAILGSRQRLQAFKNLNRGLTQEQVLLPSLAVGEIDNPAPRLSGLDFVD